MKGLTALPRESKQVGRAVPCAPEDEQSMNLAKEVPIRKRLPHTVPSWVTCGTCYFITVCAMPKGRNQLASSTTADSIAESFKFNMERGIWWVNLLLVMPDHLHAMMRFPDDPGIRKSISDWKHYIYRTYRIEWQRDFFEHRLRDDENLSLIHI